MKPAPTVPPRIERFETQAYGLFLHWGLYSLLARGEWTRHHHRMDPNAYEALAGRFTADAWDPRGLAAWARSVGFRYLCLTTRHHDGFSLYDTRGLSDFDAPHSAAGRDLVAPFAEACRAEGLGVFFYHTTLDWRHPEFDRDWDAYQRYLRDSVEVLCTHYGRVDGLWFDGNWARKDRDWQEDALYSVIRRLQPDCIIVNNSSTGARGKRGHPETDVLTFEQGAPSAAARAGAGRPVALEMCETMNSHWGSAAAGDFSYKSPGRIIETLAQCRGAGANLLLNVGPMASGALPAYERATLDVVGEWIRRCPSAGLYSGRPAAAACRGRDALLEASGDFLYFAHDLPIRDNGHLGGEKDPLRTVAGVLPPVRRVTWTDTGEELRFSQSADRSMLIFDASPAPYGTQPVVRVARIETAG